MADTTPIGFIDSIEGSVEIVRDGEPVAGLESGDPIFEGDAIQTGADGLISIVCEDGTAISLADNAEAVIDEFFFAPDTGDGSLLISMFSGLASMVSGEIPAVNPGAVSIETPVATLGVRGTTTLFKVDIDSLIATLRPDQDGTVGALDISTSLGSAVLDQVGLLLTQIAGQAGPNVESLPDAAIFNALGGDLGRLLIQLSNQAASNFFDNFPFGDDEDDDDAEGLGDIAPEAGAGQGGAAGGGGTGNDGTITIDDLFPNHLRARGLDDNLLGTGVGIDPIENPDPLFEGEEEDTPGVITVELNEFSSLFTEEGGAVGAVDVDASIINGPSMLSLQISLLNNPDGADEMLMVDLAAAAAALNIAVQDLQVEIDPASTNTVINLIGTGGGPAPIEQFQAVLRTVTYNNASDAPTDDGDNETRTIEVVATDEDGSSEPSFSTIFIVPVNDEPVNNGLPGAGLSLDEDNQISVNGLSVSDPDANGGDLSVTFSVSAGALTLGDTTGLNSIAGNGTGNLVITGTLAELNAALGIADNLEFAPPENFIGDVTFTMLTDDQGNFPAPAETDEDSFTISVLPVNDPPTQTESEAEAMEDGDKIFVDLSLLGDDVDPEDDGTTLLYTVTQQPSEGVATIDGTTLIFDPFVDFQDLAVGETRVVTATIQSTDSFGAVSNEAGVEVTVTGVNDTPTVDDTSDGTTEDGPPIDIDLTTIGNDVDSDNTPADLVYAITSQPAEGTATLDGTTLTFDPAGAFQDLALDETRDVEIKVTATDVHNATSEEGTITITVTGTNEAPVLAVSGSGESMEDGNPVPIDLTVIGDDVDSDDDGSTLNYVIVTQPDEGSASIGVDGVTGDPILLFDPGADFQDLAVNETRDVVVVIEATDSHDALSNQSEITITVTGANDAPVIGVADASGGVTEIVDEAAGENATLLTDMGDIAFADVDLSDSHTVSATLVSATDSVNGAVAERGGLTPVISDASQGDGAGTIKWTFEVQDSAIDDLAAGQTITQVYDVTVDDGNTGTDTQQVTIVITGTNDKPVIGVADDAGEVTEIADNAPGENATLLSDMGDIAFTDVDLNDGHTVSATLVSATDSINGAVAERGGLTPVISDASQGDGAGTVKWTFSVQDAAIDDLAPGQTITQIYNVIVDDGNGGTATEQVTIVINGSEDAPVIGEVDDTGAVTEIADGAPGENQTLLTDTGTLEFTDFDLADSHTSSATLVSATDSINGAVAERGTLTPVVTDDATGDGTGIVTWTFAVQDADLDDLATGQTVTQVYDVTVDDGNGGTATEQVTITITGTNDAPIVNLGGDQGTTSFNTLFTEGDGPIPIADIDASVTDVDDTNIETATITLTNPKTGDALAIDAGSLPAGITVQSATADTIVLVGSASLDDYEAAIALITYNNTEEAPDTATRTVTVVVNDGEADSNIATTFVQFAGVNDAPVARDDAYTVDEDSGTSGLASVLTRVDAGELDGDDFDLDNAVPGDMTVTAVRVGATVITDGGAGDTDANAGTISFATANGVVVLNTADGTFDYTPDANFNGVDSFDYKISDGDLESDFATVTITVNPVNDPPVIGAADDSGGVTEIADNAPGENATLLTDMGDIAFTDIDLPDAHTVSASLVSATDSINGAVAERGSLDPVISDSAQGDGAGSVKWTFSVQDSAIDDLAVGQTITQIYDVTVNDGNGGTATQQVTIVITGTNDAPVIGVADNSGGVTEITDNAPGENATLLTDMGDIAFTDVDLNDSHTVSASLVSATDSVNGAVAERGGLVPVISDASQGDGAGSVKWTFSVQDSAIDDLAAGQTITQVYDVTVNDGNGGTATQQVTIVITGTNDVPTLSGTTADATEDGPTVDVALAPLGNDDDSEDTGASLSYAIISQPSEGSALITGTTLTFDPESDFQDLALDETRDVIVQIQATDAQNATSTIEDVTVTVTGVNDAPTLSGTTANATEDGPTVDVALAPLGGDVDSDDTGATLTYTIITQPSEGSASILGTTLTFDPETDFQDLALDETRDVVVQIQATDTHNATSTVEDVTVTVTGVNDAPTLSGTTANATEDGPTVDVALAPLGGDVDSDDTGATLTYAIISQPSEGSASILGTTLTFDPSTDFQDLALDETRDVVVQVQATDTHSATSTVEDVTITVTGVNDAPTLTGTTANATEDGPTVDVALAPLGGDVDSDDTGASLTYAIISQPSEGSASILGTTLTFDPSTDFQDLALDETRDVVVQIQATDTHNATSTVEDVTVTVTGVNDAPTLSGTTANATEDGASVDVALAPLGGDVDSDDTGASLTYAIITQPTEGSASITGTTLTFNPGSDFQDLALNETRDVIVQIQATDSHNATSTVEDVTITVTGINDAPTLSGTTANANEDGASVDVALAPLGGDVDSDDTGATLTYAITSQPSEGSASISGTTLTFNPGSDFQDLALNETRDVTVKIQATDTHNATSTIEDVTITVTGVNDAPTLSGTTANATEDGASVDVALAPLGGDVDSDDTGATLTYAIISQPSEGSASILGTTLTFDPGNDFQDLALNETRDVTVKIQATDTHNATSTIEDVTITVTGVNDAPTLTGTTANATEDGASVDVALASLGGDVDSDDTGATLTYTIITQPSEGSASISGTTLTFDPGGDFQDLAVNETRDVIVQIQATDKHSATSTVEDVTITVTGVNDAPTLIGTTANATEDGPTVDVALAPLGGDVDSDDTGATLTYAIISQPSEGSASITGTTLTFDPGNDFQDLSEGQTRNVIVQIQATDQHNATSTTENVTVTVTGVNDAAVVDPDKTVWMPDGNDFDVGKPENDASPFSLMINDPTDADASDILTIEIITLPTTGTLSYTDSLGTTHEIDGTTVLTPGDLDTITYTPDGDQVPDSEVFAYEVVESFGGEEIKRTRQTINLETKAGDPPFSVLLIPIGASDVPVTSGNDFQEVLDFTRDLGSNSTGQIDFSMVNNADLSNTSTITLNGTTVTFGTDFAIGLTLDETIVNLVNYLNQENDNNLTPARYLAVDSDGANGFDTLEIVHEDFGPQAGGSEYVIDTNITDAKLVGTTISETPLIIALNPGTLPDGEPDIPIARFDDLSNIGFTLTTDHDAPNDPNQLSAKIGFDTDMDGTFDTFFTLKEFGTGDGSWVQSNGLETDTGTTIWEFEIDLSNGSLTTELSDLKAFLADPANDAIVRSEWQFVFEDDDPGNEQARFANVEITFNVAGTDVIVVDGTNDIDLIYGGIANDLLDGNDGDDVIFGDLGDDVIISGAGNDVMTGNAASETLGSGGADRFVIDSHNTDDVNTINDFNTTEGDVLELDDLFTVDTSGGLVSDFLNFEANPDNASHTDVFIDADGGGDSFVKVATLLNNTLDGQEETLVTNGDVII